MSNYTAMGLPAELGKTAFNWQRPEGPPRPLTSVEKNHIASRDRYRKKVALQVNKDTYSPTTQADADKTARIMGHSFQAKSL